MPPTPSKDYVLRVGCVHVSLDAQYRTRFFLRDESVKLPRDRKKKSSSHLGECSGQKVPSRAVSTFAAYSSDARVATWLRGVGVLETSFGVRVTVLVGGG